MIHPPPFEDIVEDIGSDTGSDPGQTLLNVAKMADYWEVGMA
jgi:hypothetical protein